MRAASQYQLLVRLGHTTPKRFMFWVCVQHVMRHEENSRLARIQDCFLCVYFVIFGAVYCGYSLLHFRTAALKIKLFTLPLIDRENLPIGILFGCKPILLISNTNRLNWF